MMPTRPYPRSLATFLSLFVSIVPVAARAGEDDLNHWPGFRGRDAAGVADGCSIPEDWDVEKGDNIQWKTAIPGLGLSSPVVWDDRVFLTTAVGEEDKQKLKVGLYGDIQPVEEKEKYNWRLLCLNRRSGKVLWDKEACRGIPKIKRHPKSSHANSTPATDGRHVIAFFGSEGLYCYDMEGKLLWKKEFGTLDAAFFMVPDAQWGFGSSPIIHDGRVIVQCDVLKNSFLAALDVESGKELWHTARDDVPTWGTPTVVPSEAGPRIVANGYKHIGGYDLATGKEVWRMGGGGDIPVPTPVFASGLVFITSAHGMAAPVFAIDPGATGELSPGDGKKSGGHIAWHEDRGGNYMQTPLVYGDLLYLCRDDGVLTCCDAKTGERKYRKRLKASTGFTASCVASDGRLFFTSEEGDVYVVKAGPKYDLIATNAMGEPCMATPAIVRGTLLIRTQRQLVAIGERASRRKKSD